MSFTTSQFAILRSWTSTQLSNWYGRSFDPAILHSTFSKYNESNDSAFVFHADKDRVALQEKPAFESDGTPMSAMLHSRARAYAAFFQQALKRYPIKACCDFIMSMHDHPLNDNSIPVFAYQKTVDNKALLLPDIDFVCFNYYSDVAYEDNIEFMQKTDKAVFVGSTSDTYHTLESVKALRSPRLQAAVYFKDHQEVDFRLPVIVQCADQEAERAIRDLHIDGRKASWGEQFSSKFLLSMDGNGATCSRVAIALQSNSVLIKYKSPFQMYYFDTLTPWLHYIPVADFEAVLSLVRQEHMNPGIFEYISKSSRCFAREYLTADMGYRYVSMLLEGYVSLFGFKKLPAISGKVFDETEHFRSAVDPMCVAHVSQIGDVKCSGDRPRIGCLGSNLALEGFLIPPDHALSKMCKFEYKVIDSTKANAWCSQGQFSGSRGHNEKVYGVSFRLIGDDSNLFSGTLDVSFVGGSSGHRDIHDGFVEIVGGHHLESFQFSVERKSSKASS